jgi:hypothetical protein
MNSSTNFQSTNYILVASALPRLNAFPELISELVDGFSAEPLLKKVELWTLKPPKRMGLI